MVQVKRIFIKIFYHIRYKYYQFKNLIKQKKNCFRDVARSLQDQSGNSMQPVAPSDPSGGEVAQLHAKIEELEALQRNLSSMNMKIAELEAMLNNTCEWHAQHHIEI